MPMSKEICKKATKPSQPSTTSLAVSVAANLSPDLSSNAFDALRAARADDRLYDPLCLNRLERVINQWSVLSKYSRGYSCIQCAY